MREAKELFRDYLEIKAQYHYDRAYFYHQESFESKVPQEMRKLYVKELMHAQALRNLDYSCFRDEIIKAEAMKIQICSFIYINTCF